MTNILVIDDDIALTETLKMILAPKEYNIIVANNGIEGVDKARRFNPDVIVLDLFMPGMDGWQVCQEIRKFSFSPILVLSAMSKPGYVVQALNEGADDYLIKPVPSSVLVAHLNNLIRRVRIRENIPQRINV